LGTSIFFLYEFMKIGELFWKTFLAIVVVVVVVMVGQ
jgi:hypothetical protein